MWKRRKSVRQKEIKEKKRVQKTELSIERENRKLLKVGGGRETLRTSKIKGGKKKEKQHDRTCCGEAPHGGEGIGWNGRVKPPLDENLGRGK